MASKTQGFFLGCLLLLAVGALLLTTTIIFLSGAFEGDLAGLGKGRVGLIVLQGPIGESRAIVAEIDDHRRDDSVKAVVLRVDSPGGEVAPSQEIHEAILRLASEKPVVASLGSVAASGGYYAAVAADSIVADPGSLVGSIGVIFSYPTGRELLEKIGVRYHVYKSGRLKDMGSLAREPTEEEEDVIDALVADVYDQFVTAVVEGRGLARDEVLLLADGRVYTGRQATEVGLVDRLGDEQAAIALAAELAGMEPDPVVTRKHRSRIPLLEFLEQFFGDAARTSWGPRLEYRLR